MNKKREPIAYGEKSVMAIDFVYDYLESGRRLKILTMLDEFHRKSPGILVAHSIKGNELGDFIEKSLSKLPRVIRVDQGVEFTSRSFFNWSYDHKIHLDFTRVQRPNQMIESFNARLRDECLNEQVFYSLEDAREKIESWLKKYNYFNPHSGLGMKTPHEFFIERGHPHIF